MSSLSSGVSGGAGATSSSSSSSYPMNVSRSALRARNLSVKASLVFLPSSVEVSIHLFILFCMGMGRGSWRGAERAGALTTALASDMTCSL